PPPGGGQRSTRAGLPADPAAPPNKPPVASEDDDVDAVAAEPGPLVEALRRGPREADPCAESDDRALRRRAAHGEVEHHRLAEPDRAEPPQGGRNAQLELAPA